MRDYMRSRVLVGCATAVLAAAVVAGCGGSDPAALGGIKGVVRDAAGAVIAGVQVVADTGGSTTSSVTGEFALASVPVGSRRLSCTKTGLLPAVTLVQVAANDDAMAVVAMLAGGHTETIDATAAQTVGSQRPGLLNGSVTFQANSIQTLAGAPVTSAVVKIATSAPGDAGFADTFPGQFLGIPTGQSAPVPIESFGWLSVNLRDAQGNKLKLDPTKPATLTFPVDPGADPLDATVPLWWLNEETGVWTQEGVLTRVVNPGTTVYTAPVTHFTIYNMDKWFNGGAFTVRVVDASNQPVRGAWVAANSYGESGVGIWQGRFSTGADGQVTMMAPAGFLIVKATKGALTGNGEGHRTGTMTITIR